MFLRNKGSLLRLIAHDLLRASALAPCSNFQVEVVRYCLDHAPSRDRERNVTALRRQGRQNAAQPRRKLWRTCRRPETAASTPVPVARPTDTLFSSFQGHLRHYRAEGELSAPLDNHCVETAGMNLHRT